MSAMVSKQAQCAQGVRMCLFTRQAPSPFTNQPGSWWALHPGLHPPPNAVEDSGGDLGRGQETSRSMLAPVAKQGVGGEHSAPGARTGSVLAA